MMVNFDLQAGVPLTALASTGLFWFQMSPVCNSEGKDALNPNLLHLLEAKQLLLDSDPLNTSTIL